MKRGVVVLPIIREWNLLYGISPYSEIADGYGASLAAIFDRSSVHHRLIALLDVRRWGGKHSATLRTISP